MARDLWLVAVETAHIQSYIFNSNRLKENIGASYLVAAATDEWARQAVEAVTQTFSFGGKAQIEKDPPLDAEIIYAGGGNFVCLFRTEALAQAFLGALSRKVLFEAPGLHIVGHLVKYVWDEETPKSESLSTAIQTRLLRDLKEQRNTQPLSRGLLGLGVTTMCDSTSQPAVTLRQEDGEHHIYSAEAIAKQVYAPKANKQLKDELGLQPHFRYPLDFDDLGRTVGEKSYVAVVHADGNGMGLLIQKLAKQFPSSKQNRDYIDSMRQLSQKIKDATQRAVHATMQVLQNQPFDDEGVLYDILSDQAPLRLTYDRHKQQWILPFRPLISGGDDVTFVCDGRIGLSLAALYLRTFEQETQAVFKDEKNKTLREMLKNGLTACAGVAIVKSHYPFARAYELAEELCQSAKKQVEVMFREHKAQNEAEAKRFSGLDWHFTAGGLYGDLEAMRDREYEVETGTLTLRPLFLDYTPREYGKLFPDTVAHDYHSWRTVERIVTEFQQKWSENRSKAKDLMDVLRRGPEAVNAYQTRSLTPDGLELPQVAGFDVNGGWHEETVDVDGEPKAVKSCCYYDALELLDLYVTLDTPQVVAHG